MAAVAPFCSSCCSHHRPSTRHRRLRRLARRAWTRLALAVDRVRGRRD